MKLKLLALPMIVIFMWQCKDKKEEAVYLKKQATEALYESKFDEAFSSIKASLAYNPYDPEAWYILGNIYFNKKLIDSAIYAYTKAIETDSTFGPAYANRGKILKERKKLNEACRDFLHAEKFGVRSLYEDTKFCK